MSKDDFEKLKEEYGEEVADQFQRIKKNISKEYFPENDLTNLIYDWMMTTKKIKKGLRGYGNSSKDNSLVYHGSSGHRFSVLPCDVHLCNDLKAGKKS